MTENIKWEVVQVVNYEGLTSFVEYISEDGTLGKIVYDDDYEEIYEIAN